MSYVGDTTAKIDQLKELAPDWDSYGAPGIALSVRERAKHVVELFAGPLGYQFVSPVVGPTPDGGVVLIWRGEGRPKLQVFVAPSDAVRYVLVLGRQVLAQGPVAGPTDVQPLLQHAAK